ncbi:MAG: hypothetical protein JRJ19_10555 [Deltaproteobacteria bacterium]|nr:hypothetical protein [Deltaproteobacteria bacterium]MBW1872498.1 hypothetical protein [Deltaproteobacteria bacterium]
MISKCTTSFIFLCLLGMTACSSGGGQTFYLNLFAEVIPDEDPFAEVNQLQVNLQDGSRSWNLYEFESQAEFGPIGSNSDYRIEVSGIDNNQAAQAWGFSPPLHFGQGTLKTTLFFTSNSSAVAHAGPTLIDPQDGLSAIGTPISLKLEGEGSQIATATVAYNSHHMYFEIEVQDDKLVPNSPDKWSGDLVVLVIDGNGDSQPEAREFDDLAVVFGSEQFVEIWPSGSGVVPNFVVSDTGYTIFATIPIDNLTNNDGPGPNRLMGLGIELRDDDGNGQATVIRWPPDWEPNPDGFPADSYFAYGTGALALKTRIIDACKVERDKVSFDAGIDDFIDSGAVPLTRVLSPAEDNVQIYALWDSEALTIAISSDDQTYCTQNRANNDREEILRDDAVELVVAVDKDHVYRALFNLTGSTAYDRIGSDDWNPNEIYFRFDLDGPLPSNDCQEGQGYTFKVRIPWNELGYLETPVVEKTFAFDLVLYDNDRGARSISAFSPMGPSEDLQALGELRLFEY